MSVPCGNFPSNVTIRSLFPSAFFLVAFFLVLSLMFVVAALRPLQASDTEEQSELLLSAPIKPDLVPGMQATIDILGGKRTVMDYILTPIQKASRAAFREK